jgi:hypothetical protein
VSTGTELEHVNGKILVVWRESEPDTPTICVQYFQEFGLDGFPINVSRSMFSELSGCPTGEEILTTNGNLTILEANVFNDVYFTAWDGNAWSIPQVQRGLANFTDPAISNRSFSRHGLLLDETNTVHVIGCDTGLGSTSGLTTNPAGCG